MSLAWGICWVLVCWVPATRASVSQISGAHAFPAPAAPKHGVPDPAAASLQVAGAAPLAQGGTGRADVAATTAAEAEVPGPNATAPGPAAPEAREAALRGSPNRTRLRQRIGASGQAAPAGEAAVEYTISSPSGRFLYLLQAHDPNGASWFEAKTFQVARRWRPRPDQSHFLWTVTGPDEDGDVRIANVMFPDQLLTLVDGIPDTWGIRGGSCSLGPTDEIIVLGRLQDHGGKRKAAGPQHHLSAVGGECYPQWLIYSQAGIPKSDEEGAVWMFHESQLFLEHTCDVAEAPYAGGLWLFDPPLPAAMIYQPLEREEEGWFR